MKDILSRIPADEFVTFDDGFVYYWPQAFRGAYSSQHLKVIADELDRRNAAWEKDIKEYFEEKEDRK